MTEDVIENCFVVKLQ